MYAEELLVHDSSQGQGAKGFHTRIVDFFRVLVFAFELEGEIVCQMPALVIAAEEPQCVGIPDLE